MWWTIGGWAIAALGAAVVVWALFWDRARGRLRCRRCWYALEETPAGGAVTCPECGRVHAARRQMLKTRRRWWRAAAGVLVVLAGLGLVVTPAVRARGAMGVLPTWALIEMMPLWERLPRGTYTPRTDPGDQLINRLLEARVGPGGVREDTGVLLSHRQQRYLLRRIARGNMLAPAGSVRWAETYGAWFAGQRFRFGRWDDRHYAGGAEADERLIALLDEIQSVRPPWQVRTREVWPRGVPVHIETISMHAGWTSLRTTEHARWVAHGAERTEGTADFGRSFPLPAIDGDRVRLELELSEYASAPWEREEGEAPLRTGRFELAWRVVDSIEEVITPVRSAELDALVAEGLEFPEEAWHIDARGAKSILHEGVVFGVLFTYYDGETPLGAMEGRWRAEGLVPGKPGGSWGNWVSFADGDGDLIDTIDAVRAAGRLRVKAEGKPELALEFFDAERCWVGEVWFDVPPVGDGVPGP
ncbi:MAG: hypothetical protein RIB60_07035 [Phycisphaerales bacterium]